MSSRASEPSGSSPLVGRRQEIETFRTALRNVAAGRPRVIQVTGEIGIGRTRLLNELANLVDTRAAVWLMTRPGYQDDEPLGPLHHAEVSEPLPALDAALATPGDSSDPFGHLIGALSQDARRRSVWLLMDDLHAADEATWAFTERLLAAVFHGALRRSRIGVVLSLLSGRETEGLRERLATHDRRGAARHLALASFTTNEMRRYLETRFDAVPDEQLERLLGEASGGNPLLLLELVLFLRRSGFLQQADRRLSVFSGTNDLHLPRDLTSLLKGKIGSISGPCRHAMTLAAFLGSEFDAFALAGLLGQDSARLEPLIDEAAAASLVARREGRKVSFKHPAARELFYQSPDPESREETHLRICESLIGEFGEHADDHCLAITHHLLRAGIRADPVAVLHYASQAAELAFRHHSYYLAGRYFESAARAGGESPPAERRADLYTRAGESFQRWSDGARSNACFEKALRLYEACDDLAGCARALHGMLRNRISFGEGGAAASETAARLQRLIGALPEPDFELKVRVHDALASYYHNIARYDIAESYAQAASTIARNSPDPTLRCIPVTSLALAQMEQLRLIEARTTWLEGLSWDRAAGAVRYEGLHLQRLPVPLYCMGETQEAARYNQASYHHNESIGNTGELCLNLTVDVMIANLRGEFDSAILAGREAMELMATTRYLWSAPSLIGALAFALTMRRRFDEAESVIAHLAANGLTFEDTGPYRSTAARLMQLVAVHRGGTGVDAAAADRVTSVRGLRIGSLARLCNEAELALFQHRPERLSGVHDALEFVHRRGLALSLGWCGSIPRSLALSTALRSGMARASAYFAEAAELAERTNSPLELGRVDLYRGIAALACGANPEDAHRDLTRALACFTNFDAPALVWLAEDALSRVTVRPDKTR